MSYAPEWCVAQSTRPMTTLTCELWQCVWRDGDVVKRSIPLARWEAQQVAFVLVVYSLGKIEATVERAR